MLNPIGQFPDSWNAFSVNQKAAFVTESLDFQRPADDELKLITRDEGVRRATMRIFDRLDGTQTLEQSEFLAAIETQFERALAVWTEKYPLKIENLPTTTGLTTWLETLSHETLNGLMELGANRLVLIPPKKTVQILRALDAHKTIPGQEDSKNSWPEFWNTVGAKKWKYAITKTVEVNPLIEEILYKDYPTNEQRRTNEQIVAEYGRRFAEKSVGIMPPHGYLPTIAGQMAEGRVLDRDTWTAFKKPADAQVLPVAGWDNDLVNLDRCIPGGLYGYLRCLPWVEGEMAV